jgi:hypothetical protein
VLASDTISGKLAAESAYNDSHTLLLKMLVKGWCYFPHFRGAKYSSKQFSKFSLPNGRYVHSTSIASYKQLQDLLEELLFRLRSSIRNCPEYKSIPVWVPPDPEDEPDFVPPDLMQVQDPPKVEIAEYEDFVPPQSQDVGPKPVLSAFNVSPPEREPVELPKFGEPKLLKERPAREEPQWKIQQDEALPACMPPVWRTKAPEYEPPPALPFPKLIDKEQYLLARQPKKYTGFTPIFALDVSGTMAGQKLTEMRATFALLMHERGPIAASMNGGGFNLLAFGDGAELWSPRPVRYSKGNLNAAQTWVSQWPGRGSSNALKGLELAFAQPSADCVFLLTDGLLDQKMQLIELLKRQEKERGGKQLKIHCICFGSNNGLNSTSYLSRVARESGGSMTLFTHDMKGLEQIQRLQQLALQSIGLKEQAMSKVQQGCRNVHNTVISAQVDAHNSERLQRWEEANAAIREAAWQRHEQLLEMHKRQHEQRVVAVKAKTRKQYKQLCQNVAQRNQEHWLEAKTKYEAELKEFERESHLRLSIQNTNRERISVHRKKVEAAHRQAVVEAQKRYERASKQYFEKKENFENIQQQKLDKYKNHLAQIQSENSETMGSAKEKWEAEYASRNQSAYAAHAVAMAEWKEEAEAVQELNGTKMNQSRLEHSEKVETVKTNNERRLAIARDEYEEEVAAVEYLNASIQPVVQKADRANILIVDLESLMETIFRETANFQGSVDIPVVVASLQKVFPGMRARLLVQAFEEHFTPDELRTRSFYPYFVSTNGGEDRRIER